MEFIDWLFPSQKQIESFNLWLPLWLAKYHFWFLILGFGVFTLSIALLKAYMRNIEKKNITMLKTMSVISFIVFASGVVGWLMFPVYQYLISRGILLCI